jgi:co-chaperonin GroES (HSP10)
MQVVRRRRRRVVFLFRGRIYPSCICVVVSYLFVVLFMVVSFMYIHLTTYQHALVISMGPGREEENGLIQPMPNIQPGDIVIAKHPWGIGPKDEETADGKKLSFMRGGDIAAVVMGKLVEK